jgi:hypothetical protein
LLKVPSYIKKLPPLSDETIWESIRLQFDDLVYDIRAPRLETADEAKGVLGRVDKRDSQIRV